jgi:hypothetical protein
VTLHTSNECTFNPPENEQTGAIYDSSTNCTNDSNGDGTGCTVQGPVGSYGTSMNAQGGGVYAMEWTSTYIRVYFFPRNAIPDDITAGNPDPTRWGLPTANFDTRFGDCDIDANFVAQTIVSSRPV